MGTIFYHHHYLRRHQQLHTSQLANLHRSSEHRNVRRTHVVLAMPIGSLTLTRSSANKALTHHRFPNLKRLLCFDTPNLSMEAEETKDKILPENIKDKNEEEGGGQSPKSMEPPPPQPPEKPLPGDCCGSGCVRCVWDLYYEELEDYNKLYKSESKTS